MPNAELLTRFRTSVRYQRARSWQKPLLDPRRFLANQLRKYGLASQTPGALHTVPAFHVPEFTVVEGETVSQQIVSYSLFEPELTEAFLHLVNPGDVVLDIGMHLGYYATLFAVLVGERGQVHGFEPTPSTREIAVRNTSQFPQIQVHPLAVWSSNKTVVLRDYGSQWMGFNSLIRAKLTEEPVPPKEIEVQAITLEEFRSSLEKGRKVSLMKIDAESAERDIIRGGKQLLENDRPLISVEVGDQGSSNESRLLLEDLRALDYVPWEFQSGQFVRHEARETYGYDNLIFAPRAVDLKVVS